MLSTHFYFQQPLTVISSRSNFFNLNPHLFLVIISLSRILIINYYCSDTGALSMIHKIFQFRAFIKHYFCKFNLLEIPH